ncbi:MAG: hypothetical protein EXR50_08360, partial [Dehalococcoidia bacterium]|nr:hypothetical protein [Dehalococcoidia bacterium]
VYANADEAFDYPGRPPIAMPDEECYGLNALYRLYPARSGWVFLACPFEDEWQALCHAVGLGNLLEDSRFQTEANRLDHDAELVITLSQLFQSRTAAEWQELLTAADVACVQADALTMGQFFEEEPHVRENNFLAPANHVRFGNYLRHGGMVSFSEMSGIYGPGVLRGQHTRAILRELGYKDEDIADLYARGIVSSERRTTKTTITPTIYVSGYKQI